MNKKYIFIAIIVLVLVGALSVFFLTQKKYYPYDITGNWLMEGTTEYPLTITYLKKNVYAIDWHTVLDSDVYVSGKVHLQNSNLFSGKVDFVAGDMQTYVKKLLTIEYIHSSETLSLGLDGFFDEPVLFHRMASTATTDELALCEIELGENIISMTERFLNIMKENDSMGILHEPAGESDILLRSHLYEYRIYREEDNGGIITLDRLQIDLANQVISYYDPAEDLFIPLDENYESFFSVEDAC